MKKRLLILTCLCASLSLSVFGCKKDKIEPITVPDTLVEDSKEPSIEVPPEEAPTSEPVTEPEIPGNYPHWSEIHDYNADQEVLSADSAIKDLSIQLGNTPEELHLTWFSRSSSKGKVKFTDESGRKLEASVSTQSSISVPGCYRNRAVISGLESNTSYTYQVSNGGDSSPVYTYRTHDLYSDEFTFTIVSDQEIGIGDEEDNVLFEHGNAWRLSLNRMREQIPESEFILSLGDQVGKPDHPAEYDELLNKSVLYSTPFLPVMGNHDVGSGYWGDHFNPPNISSIGTAQGDDGDYWFTKENALFMVVNTSTVQEKDIHETFVADAIAKNPDAKWRIVVSHYSPATNVERYISTREDIRYTFSYMADNFDIDLFLGAHDHTYGRSYFLDWDCDPIDNGEPVKYEFHNPEKPLFVVFSTATGSIYREPDNYPWIALSAQNDVPQISKAHVTENSFTISTYDADTWTELDSFTIYKD